MFLNFLACLWTRYLFLVCGFIVVGFVVFVVGVVCDRIGWFTCFLKFEKSDLFWLV